jgi:glyoxylase-like metal-dependent hydrolase (beta-lactamase superfamily II)/ferredoxin
MARLAERVPENPSGEFYVDASCIDCATCRHLLPAVYRRSERGQSFVARQPTAQEQERALMALVACPTASIGTETRLDARQAAARFPEPVEDEVYYCGFTSPDSFGASSYLIRRPAGNVLVDSPRAARPLLERLEALGGVRTLFLTHRDDVADHAALRRRFGCERILHEADVTAGTRDVERRLAGEAPLALADDLLAIPVPGHTAGSTALLYRERFLFSGDHLMGTAEGRLRASRDVCWHSWPRQLRSLARLLEHRFRWLLPGHGARVRGASAEAMAEALRALLAELAAAGPRPRASSGA